MGILPRTHGSALFTRGETQALVVTTLGTKIDEQKIEELEGQRWKSYMLHYNFPSYSVGEVRPIRGPGRREIGHGALAERAIEPVIPSDDTFPYTIRVVSDILESNGSSSMATVCGGSLALMDAGVPIKAPVAGIAMGLIKEGDRVAVLTDILGVEDHLGDMDFKVTGTSDGITAFQMDAKIPGINFEIFNEALEKARVARLKVLEAMALTLDQPRTEISVYAPRITMIKVAPDKMREIIGPGGRTIRSHHRADRSPDRYRGRRHRQDLLLRLGERASGRGDDPGPDRGSRDRTHLPRESAADRQLRRLHRDPPGSRRALPHLGDRPPSGGTGRGCGP